MTAYHSFRRFVSSLVVHGLLLTLGAFMLAPFLWMVVTSLKDQTEVLVFPPRWIPDLKLYAPDPDRGGMTRVKRLDEDAVTAVSSETSVRNVSVLVQALEPGDNARTWRVPLDAIKTKRFLWENYPRAWTEISREVTFSRYFYVTTVVAVVTTIAQIMTSVLAAYAFARMRFFLNHLIFTLFLGTMMVPQPVLLIPNFILLAQFGWLNSFKALIIPWTANVFGIFLIRQYFLTIPQDLLDAAKIDGCGHLRILRMIMIPLSKPILWTLALFSFISSWNSFLWPLIVTNSPDMRTIQVGLASLQSEVSIQWTLLMAASTFSLLPLIVLFLFVQRHLIESFARTGLKG